MLSLSPESNVSDAGAAADSLLPVVAHDSEYDLRGVDAVSSDRADNAAKGQRRGSRRPVVGAESLPKGRSNRELTFAIYRQHRIDTLLGEGRRVDVMSPLNNKSAVNSA